VGKKKTAQELGRRERQILDIIFRLGEASVADVLAQMHDPPAYDSVRTMIRLLEKKQFLRHRREGNRYVYSPTQSHKVASQSALQHLMKTFFQGSVADTVAAAIDLKSDNLSDDELDRLEQMIAQARKEGR
jgi:predicted transcriptional regulator